MVRSRLIVAVTAAGLLLPGCSKNEAREPSSGPPPETIHHPSGSRPSPSGSSTGAPERTTLTQTSAGSGQLAEANPARVPRVVSMAVPEAVRTLRREDYGCAIVDEESRGDGGQRRIVAQAPRPDARGFEGQLVHLTVSSPFPEGALPPGCVDQRDGGAKTTDGEKEEMASGAAGERSSTSSGQTKVSQSDSGLVAPSPNPEPVPNVVGMTVKEAERALGREDYRCAIAAGLKLGGKEGETEPRRVVAQEPEAGSSGRLLEDVILAVSRPYPGGELPSGVGCIDVEELGATDRTFRDFLRE